MARKGIANTAVWILLGLLILGLAGFGATNLGGTVRSVGEVGDKPISVVQYTRALQQDIRALEAEIGRPVSFAEAQQIGLERQTLSRLVTQRALDNEASELGLSVGDENLREQIIDIPAFQNSSGEFDRESYRFALSNTGLSEEDFETGLREETARTILQGAVISGVNMPATFNDTLVTYIAEARDFSWARLGRSYLETLPDEPTEADLKAYYDENIADYTLPETRKITYAWLTPAMILDEVEVDEAALRTAYDSRSEEFNRPERRLVERLVYPDDATAETARGKVDAGEATFEDLVSERGLALADIDLGDVAKGELEGAGDGVFAAEIGNVVGPFPSSLGPALFRVNAILAAQTTTFEEAQPALRDELAADRARRVIDAQIGNIDDLMAGGATLEELGDETDMETGQIDWFPGADGGIAAYEAFQSAAAAAKEGDFPEVLQLADGGIFALRLDEVVAPRPEPLDAVRDRVARGWENGEVRTALRAQAEDVVARMGEGRDFAALDLIATEETGVTRNGFVAGTPPALLFDVFALSAPGEMAIVDDADGVIVARLDAIAAPDMDDEDTAQLATALAEQTNAGIAQDLFQAYANDIRARAGLTIDQQALNAVHAQFQ